MAQTTTMKVVLQRDSLQTPWGFRLQGGADFRIPFTIIAGSPAEGFLHRGDVILEIDGQSTQNMQHTEALELVKRAGATTTFLVQRGPTPSPLYQQRNRPMSALPFLSQMNSNWGDMPSILSPLHQESSPLSPMGFFRNRFFERVPNPKPLLSQTGSPLMPGPVPSVSTKTRGSVPPPSFHTERQNIFNTSQVLPYESSYSPSLPYTLTQNSNANTRQQYQNNYSRQSTSTITNRSSYQQRQQQNNDTVYQPPWRDSLNESDVYVPSYQKQVPTTPNIRRQYTTVSSSRPHSHSVLENSHVVHRQFNSPLSLYSQNNVQDVINRVSKISIRPLSPNLVQNHYVTVKPQHKTNTTFTSSALIYTKPVKYHNHEIRLTGTDF